MKIVLKRDTIESLEDLTKKKMTRNGDEIVKQVAKMAEEAGNKGEPVIEICDNTERFAAEEVADEDA